MAARICRTASFFLVATAVSALLACGGGQSAGSARSAGEDESSAEEAGSTEDASSPEARAAQADACASAGGPIDRIVCFADLATRTGDLSRCDDAEDEGVRYQCYAIFAERQGDPAPCRAIPTRTSDLQGLHDICLVDVAGVLGEAELCPEIVGPGLRDSCWWAVVRETGEAELCDRIQDPGQKSGCTGEPVYIDINIDSLVRPSPSDSSGSTSPPR